MVCADTHGSAVLQRHVLGGQAFAVVLPAVLLLPTAPIVIAFAQALPTVLLLAAIVVSAAVVLPYTLVVLVTA